MSQLIEEKLQLLPKTNYIVIDSNEKLADYLEEIKKNKKIVVDTETTGLDPYDCTVILIQLGTKDKQYIIHATQVDVTPLKEYLESKDVLKIFQNHKFDYKMIKHHFNICIRDRVYDTFLAELIIYGGRYNFKAVSSMANLAKRYLGIDDLDKKTRISFTKWRPGATLTEKHYEYSALDVIIPQLIMELQIPVLKKECLTDTAKLEFDVSYVIGDMELNGMYIDKDMWLDLAKQVDEKYYQCIEELDKVFKKVCNIDLFGKPIINYGSTDQVTEVLHKLGINVPDTNDNTLAEFNQYEAIQKIRDFREWKKSKESYGVGFLDKINPVTGRVHTNFFQILSTGRLSSSDPNLQNIKAPREEGDLNFRAPFRIQNSEHSILTADYSGCELRILAEESKDPVLTEAYLSEIITGIEADIHSVVASMLYKVKVSKKEHPELRKKAKNLNFGLVYKMSEISLGKQLGIPTHEAASLMELYFKTFPSVKDYIEESSKSASTQGYSKMISGRKRKYDLPSLQNLIEEKGSREGRKLYRSIIASIERQGANAPIQGCNADITKRALIGVSKHIIDNNYNIMIIGTVHDEIIFEGEITEEISRELVSIMEDAEAYYLKSVPPRVSYDLCDSWTK